jgi:putative membrane protein
MAVGGADVVPGVSGGTIAFITGIYERLLDAISSFDGEALQYILKFRWQAFWKKVDGTFVVVLLGGILLSILTLAKVIHFLLDEYPIQLWSFFFGLVILAAYVVAKEISRWRGRVILAGIAGIAIAYFITLATPAQTPTDLWFVFISGAVAICAMILPGISGSFILLILGKYEYILGALNERNLLVIAVFGAGCVVGLLSFARVISWLLDRYYYTAIALLAGFMIGSLNKIWPWKEIISMRTNSKGEEVPFITENVLPGVYQEVTGQSPYLGQAILFMILGAGVVFTLDWVASRKPPTTKTA